MFIFFVLWLINALGWDKEDEISWLDVLQQALGAGADIFRLENLVMMAEMNDVDFRRQLRMGEALLLRHPYRRIQLAE